MLSDIKKQKETLERMGEDQRHKIKKSKKEMKVDQLGTQDLQSGFENEANELSVELSYEDIKNVVLQSGVQLEVGKDSILSTYTVNEVSMMKYSYECASFVVLSGIAQKST